MHYINIFNDKITHHNYRRNLNLILGIGLFISATAVFSHFSRESNFHLQFTLAVMILLLLCSTIIVIYLVYRDTWIKDPGILDANWILWISLALTTICGFWFFPLHPTIPSFYFTLTLIQFSTVFRAQRRRLIPWLAFAIILSVILFVAAFLLNSYTLLKFWILGLTILVLEFTQQWLILPLLPRGSSIEQTTKGVTSAARDVFRSSINISLWANLLVYLSFLVFIILSNTTERDAIIQLASTFYSVSMQLQATLLGIVAGFGLLIIDMDTSSSRELKGKLANGLEGFLILYIFMLSVSALGLILYTQIDLSVIELSLQNLRMERIVANLAFQFSVISIVPSFLYIYALAVGFMQIRKGSTL